ncbi:type IV toxin-antitoxin system AbiEi family antitoxin domain-containing protein [Micromonospora sp. 067-2]|uniref:type IV toxin-antitoxin system AbiEi family antitoxin domain-containing protein n=1 Tax=Micromonospora sp. 067-2 TaxID=2789270 RepID=UPI00397D126A
MDALEVVRRVAVERDGIVTIGQARAAGLTVHEVQRFCRAGRWRVVARGSYLVDADLYDAVPRRARIRAAVSSTCRCRVPSPGRRGSPIRRWWSISWSSRPITWAGCTASALPTRSGPLPTSACGLIVPRR